MAFVTVLHQQWSHFLFKVFHSFGAHICGQRAVLDCSQRDDATHDRSGTLTGNVSHVPRLEPRSPLILRREVPMRDIALRSEERRALIWGIIVRVIECADRHVTRRRLERGWSAGKRHWSCTKLHPKYTSTAAVPGRHNAGGLAPDTPSASAPRSTLAISLPHRSRNLPRNPRPGKLLPMPHPVPSVPRLVHSAILRAAVSW